MGVRLGVMPWVLIALVGPRLTPGLAAADWPTWRADAARSAVTPDGLPGDLTLHWKLQLPAPRPAWPDDQGKVRFDLSYEPVVAGGLVFVGSMVDDCVAAYRLSDGAVVWRFHADGPVRFAPLVYHDRVLFVSDDGHLYCLTADRGTLLWKRRGGPDNRKVLGNDRLISMWPARGAPVVFGETVYWAAGIWPFMGVFVQAVDIGSGQPVWTNSGSGSNYIVQQHNSPAFAGIAPQGYLTVSETTLLVAGGMTVPAAFDRQTGRLLYYRPGDRELGKDAGSFEVLLGPGWFANRGRLQRLTDGEPLVTAPVDIVTAQGTYGVADKHLVASQLQVVRYVETSVDKKGKEKRTAKLKLPESWRAPLPEGITTIHVKTPDRLVASDGGSRVVLLSIPLSADDACRVEWDARVEGTICRMLVADSRLLVVSQDGSISCFGSREQGPPAVMEVRDAPMPDGRAVAREDVERTVASWLQHTNVRAGYAVVDQAPSDEACVALARQTEFHILALQEDEQVRESLRQVLRARGLLGTRVAVVPGNVQTADLPPYMAELVVTDLSTTAMPPDPDRLRAVVNLLRPYSGTALSLCHEQDPAALAASCAAMAPGARFDTADDRILIVRRPGPLPGAGTWTSQNGDAGNTLVSPESRVKAPLGLLWFGGPSNREVLPRHGHGPTPQVIGGRLFIEGRDMLRALDVYTGRLLWQRALKDVGLFFDRTDHHPGAGAIGGNYVCTSDSVYVVWGRRCLRLDPATGNTLAEFSLPPDESGQQPFWGYLAVSGDYLVAGSSPMLLYAPAPGEELDKDDKDQLKRQVPLFGQFGEGSRRLVVLDRLDGHVRWTRDAQYNFRHNAIALGGGKVFCLDRMTEQRLAHFRRRGQVPVADFCLYALDIQTGQTAWQSSDHAFGTWLAYSEPVGLLLQGGSKNHDRGGDEVGKGLAVFDGATGKLAWRVDDDYGGPPLLYPDTIITQGTAYDLQTGAVKNRHHPLTGEVLRWKFARNYGCNTAIGCTNLLTFRSAAAGYFDLANDGGTGNWGGFRSSCTSNLIAADGVLSAPDYTRTCTCSYQNQCSLALVPMPDAEMWTFNPIPSSGQRVQRLGINFGAPGDRKADDGTLWLDFPSVGGPSPDVPLTLTGDRLEYCREHASVAPSQYLPWVFASGVRGVRHLQLRLASAAAAGAGQATYQVRLFWRDVTTEDLQGPGIDIRLQGQSSGKDQRVLAEFDTAPGGSVQQWHNVLVGEFLTVDIDVRRGSDDSRPRPMLCGIEVLPQP